MCVFFIKLEIIPMYAEASFQVESFAHTQPVYCIQPDIPRSPGANTVLYLSGIRESSVFQIVIEAEGNVDVVTESPRIA